MSCPVLKCKREIITEAGRELADPAGAAASAIRRMSPFCFFLELWDLWHSGNRIWSRTGGSNIINNDVWPLPGPSVPTL